MNKKSQFITALMIAGVVLVTGLAAGYLIWGNPGDGAPDYAAALRESAHYLKALERKNARLAEEIGLLKEQITEAQQIILKPQLVIRESTQGFVSS